jgi:glutamyl-tRNA synthetase
VAAEPLSALRERLADLEDWQPDALQTRHPGTADALEIGFGKIGMPLRVALMGHGQSPGINQTLWLVGKERSLARIDLALAFIAQRRAGGDGGRR